MFLGRLLGSLVLLHDAFKIKVYKKRTWELALSVRKVFLVFWFDIRYVIKRLGFIFLIC